MHQPKLLILFERVSPPSFRKDRAYVVYGPATMERGGRQNKPHTPTDRILKHDGGGGWDRDACIGVLLPLSDT